ncbi:reverse transcriptase (RNA-dependent DNA polymerase) domain-containing protein [Phthorimaea operculella]|nr:reverse transcriptase (RNA-dependent DNA polymerase) domain-containing protein [Phthorimaea operculella]
MRDIITKSAQETLNNQKLVPRKKWLTKEIIDLILARRELRNKTDDISAKEYRILTNKITTKCREEKEKDALDTCNKVEDLMKRGKIDQAYNIIRQIDKKPQRKGTAILEEAGKVLIDSKDIAKRWARYIEKLYEGDGMLENFIEKKESVDIDNLGPDILREEFEIALNNIQNGKAVGLDNLHIELIKYVVCEPLKDEIFSIIQEMYRSGQIPRDFQQSRIVTLPKKPKTLKCEEHRTLSLISQASKILIKIIQNRVRPISESFLGPDQFGFRKGKGTREAILALRSVVDRRLDLGLETYVAFIDLEKAFDKVNWEAMMKILRDIGIDYRDRKIIYELYKHQETVIEIGQEKGQARIRQGVRQGCPLSPLIFNIFIETAIKKIIDSGKGGVKFNGENIQFIRFADDIAAIGRDAIELEELVNEMDRTFNQFGMKININKTKILMTTKHPKRNRPIHLNNQVIEEVKQFKYLGSLITSDSRCTPDIKARIAMAKKAFNGKKQLLKARISSHVLLNLVKEKRTIFNVIENRRGNMLGHLLRHDDLLKTIIEGKIEGRRGRGRPRRAYMDQVKEKIGVMSYKEVKEKAQKRADWILLHRQEQSS